MGVVISVIARQQVQSLVRQRVFLATAGILLLMTALAGVIGWSSHDTIVRVYDQATIYLADQGQPAPPNPFDLKPTLSLLSNMEIYIPLIGALLALVVGHLSLADDETNGIGRLIFTRPISRASSWPQGARRRRRARVHHGGVSSSVWRRCCW